MCEAFFLNVTVGDYDGGRGFPSISWALTSPGSAAALVTSLSASENAYAVPISPSMLTKGVTYTISAQFSNFLNSAGSASLSFTPTGCLYLAVRFSDDLTSLTFSSG